MVKQCFRFPVLLANLLHFFQTEVALLNFLFLIPGTFLLRDSAQSEYLFSVSFRRYKRTLHARIEQKNHYFSFDFSDTTLYSAPTITDLIAYYNDATK